MRWINVQTAGGRAARDGGLREGDVIVELAGEPVKTTHQRFNMHIKLNYKVGDELPLTVLRGGKRRSVRIRLAE